MKTTKTIFIALMLCLSSSMCVAQEIKLTTNDSITLSAKNDSSEYYFKEGENDARKYYKGYNAAGTATLATGMLVLPSFITAIACSNTPPKLSTLSYPDSILFHGNADYRNGYLTKVYTKKQGKVWLNFGIAIGIDALIIGLMVLTYAPSYP